MSLVLTVALAARLRDAGLDWTPKSGDRFVLPDRDLDDQVFVISEMTIEPQPLESGGIVRFNGTTEWALDSIEQSEAIWLPHEHQLRELLGGRFARLEATQDGLAVVLHGAARSGDGQSRYFDVDAECAYARALVGVLESAP